MPNGIITAGELTPRLSFDADRHVYAMDGKEVTGITRVLGDLGMVDTSFFTEEMREFGTLRHLVTELDDLGDLHEPSVDPRLVPTLYGWREWREREGFVPTHIEVWVYSMFEYATIVDRVGYFQRKPDERVVINLKGPARLASYGPQVWAEARAFEETSGLEVHRRLSVHIGRDGVVRVHEHTDRDDLNVWLSALAIWRWRNAHVRRAGR